MVTRERVQKAGAPAVTAPAAPPRAIMAPTNVVVRLLLRSPLHFLLSGELLLLTYTGRKSSKRFTIPVAYTRAGDVVTIFTYHAWWKNLADGAPVAVEIKRQRLNGRAEVIRDDETAIATALLAYLRMRPNAARGYNVPLDAKEQPDPDAVRQAAQYMVMVRIRLAPLGSQA